MFTDSVRVRLKSGKGGDGAASFRKEKFAPLGGPDGGDGGRGGNVFIVGDENVNTLIDYRYKKEFKAEDGENGRNKMQYGKSGEDLYLTVPVGTIVKDFKSKGLIADIKDHGQTELIAKGGRGGRGNIKFASSTRRAPKFSEPGKKGKEFDLVFELKLIADVGLIGLPNVGKSSLLSVMTDAKPKINNYHFTTLSPNLGVVSIGSDDSYVIADIPGLIEGASDGLGLGHDFLKHIERTKILAHVIDISGSEGRNPLEDFGMINKELEKYSDQLVSKEQVLILNKWDNPDAETWYDLLKDKIESISLKVFRTSALTRQGIHELKYGLWDTVKDIEDDYQSFDHDLFVEEEEIPYTIEIIAGIIHLEGPFIDDMVYRTNFESLESLYSFFEVLKRKGIIEEMEEMGLERGDTLIIAGIEFEYGDWYAYRKRKKTVKKRNTWTRS